MFHDQVVLIPGAARPVGREIARRFAVDGAALVLPHFDWPHSVEEMIDEFKQLGVPCLFMEIDLRDREQIQRLYNATMEKFGKLNYLVNNIERGGMPIVHGSYDKDHNQGQWELELETTLTAKYHLFNTFFELLKLSGDGAVINISSIAAEVGRSGPASLLFSDGYSAANQAISSFTKTWAREGAPEIRVIELMLGLVEHRHAQGTRGWSEMSDEQQTDIIYHTLLERTASTKEVADMVYFLAKHATFLTGQTITMDGGYILGSERVPEYPEGILHKK